LLTHQKPFYFQQHPKVTLVKPTPLPPNLKQKQTPKTLSSKFKQHLKNTLTPTKLQQNQPIQQDQLQYQNTL
ncbi:staphopain proregion domain-containing protein, partial [Staphylococcus aureus]|uniref:staphopain proregion domain-containing protein n=1 Tax=Staphylococcus aureus TaxID=1280 RepID=UPI0028CB2809